MAGDDPGEGVGQVSERIDVVQLTGLDQRGDDGPVLGAAVGACEQRIFSVERDRTDRTLDSVVVELDTAIIDEARQALPARERIADGLGELALLADQGELCVEPLLESNGKRPAFLLPDEATLLGAAAADVLLDRVELGDVLERLARNGRGTGGGQFVEVTPHVRPAECKLNVAPLGEPAIASIAINLEDPLEACQMGDWSVGFAIGGIDVGDARRIDAAPWPIVRRIGPELTGLCAHGRDRALASSSRRRTALAVA